jgi:ribosomal protein S18 acetylase RimI-like enzyme
MDFRFTNNYPVSQLEEIVEYLVGPRLWIPNTDYPDFLDWASRTYEEFRKESKRALLALSGNEIVGLMIYQPHRRNLDALEIKNLTVRPDKRGRYIASFLLRNAEIDGAKEFKKNRIIYDAKANNFAIRKFLLTNHYRILGRADLYGIGAGEDLIYEKKLVTIHS